ncbi:CHAD domain-containing protein [Aeoliella sp. SH292]|uniref:CHAD domain-containing protein n=1 Tax=Aeoliella sp. SH292 TaxID=3454464 RepID=UPI003F9A0C3C
MPAADKWVSEVSTTTPMSEVVTRALKLRLGDVIHSLPLAAHLADEQVEYVHAARVATRRATAALDRYRDFLPPKKRKKLRTTLKAVRASMGDARDLDVYLLRFQEIDNPVAAKFAERLAELRESAQAPIIECATPLLEKQRLRKQVAKLVESTSSHAEKKLRKITFGEWAKQELWHVWCEFRDATPGEEPDAVQLHDFRIATKRFRYAIELLDGGLPGSARKQLYPLVKNMQAKLGDLQDHAVAAEKLAGWRESSTARKEQKMLKELEQEEHAQFAEKSELFLEWWSGDRLAELGEVVESLCEKSEIEAVN